MDAASGSPGSRPEPARCVDDTQPLGSPSIGVACGERAQEEAPPETLDSRRAPPRDLKDLFKRYSRAIVSPEDLEQVADSTCISEPEWSLQRDISPDFLDQLFRGFQDGNPIPSDPAGDGIHRQMHSASVYQSNIVPGLAIIPSFLPIDIQWTLLSRLFLRDLSQPSHQTNLHLHYDIEYPPAGASFFNYPRQSVEFKPKEPEKHQPLHMERVLGKKLRWVTLGGQYDWTNKVYPDERPPTFPKDIATLLNGVFVDMEPQAAIVNLYSPGDTLSLHRDVSEETNRGLVSISLGCDGLFIIGLRDSNNPLDQSASRCHILRLHSGDAVYMSGSARYAWHGVPKIVANTSPQGLDAWPGVLFPSWRDYRFMADKRVNLNVRQMYELSRQDNSTSSSEMK